MHAQIFGLFRHNMTFFEGSFSLYLPPIYHFSFGIKAENLTELTEADYDFSDVKSEELQACYWYEYARESRAAISEVELARTQFGAKTGNVNFSPRVRNQIYSHILMSLAIASDFPKKPWSNLSEKNKTWFLKMVTALPHTLLYFYTANNPPLSFSMNDPDATTLESWKRRCLERLPPEFIGDVIKFGFFRVNMKYGHAILIEEFKKYLRNFEGKPMLDFPPTKKKEIKPPQGRKSIRDALKALGAMRLRYHCDTFSQAQKMLPQKNHPRIKGKRVPIYEYRHSLNRACAKALKYFGTLYGQLDSDKPIHFTTGWRGGTHK